MPYRNKQEAVNASRPGWIITGQQPNMVSVDNPDAGLAGQPAKITQQNGEILTIQNPLNPNDPPDTIIIKQVGNAPWKGGVGYDVVQGPTKATTAQATPSAGLDKLDQNGDPIPPGSTTKSAFVRDPKTGQTFAVTGDSPTDPNTWKPVYDPNDPSTTTNRRVIGLWDTVNNKMGATVGQQGLKPSGQYTPAIVDNADGTQTQIGYTDTGDKSFRPFPSAPSKNPSGTYTDEYVTDANGNKKLVAKVDTGDHSWHPVSVDPATQSRLVQTPNAVYSVNTQNGQDVATKLFDVDKSSPFQAVEVQPGVWARFDPNEKDPTKSLTPLTDPNALPKTIKDRNGNPMTLTDQPDGSKKYQYPPGVTPASTLNVNTTAPNLEWYDDQGNLIKSVKNANYQPPQAQLPAANTISKNIYVLDPEHPGQLKVVPNAMRVTASQALQDLASNLSGMVVDNDISVEEAKTLIEQANSAMATQAAAANTVLDYTSRGAQTGAGLLQQRAATAQGVLSDLMRTGTQRPLYAGAPDVSGLSGAIANWTAGLMGGQDTMNAAAAMVRAAQPGQAGSPAAAAATAALTQILQKRAQLTGEKHPIETAYDAAQRQQTTGGQPGLATNQVVTPSPGIAYPWQRADQMYGTTPQGDAVAQPGLAGTVPPGSPQFLGSFATPQPQPTTVAMPGIQFTPPQPIAAPAVTVTIGRQL